MLDVTDCVLIIVDLKHFVCCKYTKHYLYLKIFILCMIISHLSPITQSKRTPSPSGGPSPATHHRHSATRETLQVQSPGLG